VSVINRMLKDLDTRRGYGESSAAQFLQGASRRLPGRGAGRLQQVALAVVLLVAAVLAGMLLARAWWPAERTEVATSPIDGMAAAEAIQEPAAAVSEAGAKPDAVAETAETKAMREPKALPELLPEPAQRPAASAPVERVSAPSAAPAAPVPPPMRQRIEVLAPAADPLAPARAALDDGRSADALSLLDALSADVAGPAALSLRANALQQAGRAAEAALAWRTALAQTPEIGAWWAGLGIALEQSGDPAQALDAYREAERRGPLEPALADYVRSRSAALTNAGPTR